MKPTVAIDAAIARAQSCSPFLTQLIAAHSDVVAAVRTAPVIATVRALPEPAAASLATRLRLRRGRLFVALALGDLAGLFTLEEVTAALSHETI